MVARDGLHEYSWLSAVSFLHTKNIAQIGHLPSGQVQLPVSDGRHSCCGCVDRVCGSWPGSSSQGVQLFRPYLVI